MNADIAFREAKKWAMAIAVWMVIVLVVLAAIAWPGMYLLQKIDDGLALINWTAARAPSMNGFTFVFGVLVGALLWRRWR